MNVTRIRHIAIWVSMILLGGLGFLATSCKKEDAAAGRYPNANVILIVIDTLRADHLGCYGYSRNTSPFIDSLAEEGIIFQQMLAQTSWTRPGTASILTGLYPKHHGANTRDDLLAEEILLLPEILKKQGFHTAAFMTNVNTGQEQGFGQGFDEFFYFPAKLTRARRDIDSTSDRLNQVLLKHLRQLKQPDKNFIYIHYLDPHAPYMPVEKHFSKDDKFVFSNDFINSLGKLAPKAKKLHKAMAEMVNAYDDEILYNDKMIGQVIQTLKEKKMYSNSIIIVTSDHGEEFFEHGWHGHGKNLYQEQLLVPLIVSLPNRAHKEIKETANQVDIVPTILSLLKIPTPTQIDGADLFSKTFRPAPFSYAELNLDKRIYTSIQAENEKLIEAIHLPKTRGRKEKWFREQASIKTNQPVLELVTRSFFKKRNIQVLLEQKVIGQFEITHKKIQTIDIPLPGPPGEKTVTIKSLTPGQYPVKLGRGKLRDRDPRAFCIFNSKNVKVDDIPGELFREYYSLAQDPGEQNNLYKQPQFMKTIIHLNKQMRKFLSGRRFTPANKKPIKYDKEQLEALKALGYIN